MKSWRVSLFSYTLNLFVDFLWELLRYRLCLKQNFLPFAICFTHCHVKLYYVISHKSILTCKFLLSMMATYSICMCCQMFLFSIQILNVVQPRVHNNFINCWAWWTSKAVSLMIPQCKYHCTTSTAFTWWNHCFKNKQMNKNSKIKIYCFMYSCFTCRFDYLFNTIYTYIQTFHGWRCCFQLQSLCFATWR